jgi:hypothetical protein
VDALRDNAFFVLGLETSATAMEIERQGRKLLGMLELGMEAGREYQTPVGRFERTEQSVRRAMAELQDPRRRLMHELWAAAGSTPASDGGSETDAPARAWDDALAAFGWRRS